MAEDLVRVYQLRDGYSDLCTRYARGELEQLAGPEEYWHRSDVRQVPGYILGECRTMYDDAVQHPVLFDPNERPFRQYVLQERLGHGSYGVVWRATRLPDEKPVAVKVLRQADVVDAQREFKALSRVPHDHVIGVIHSAQSAGPHRHPKLASENLPASTEGRYDWLVLEWAAGGSLKEVCLAYPAPLKEDRLLEWMKQLTSAVAFVHAQGVFHRDLKPSNILLTGQGAIKVADFGIARIPDAATDGGTRTGSQFGSNGYQPPEIADGLPSDFGTLSDAEKADFWTRVDVYGVGAVLYAIVTGKAPRDRKTNSEPYWLGRWSSTSRRLREVCKRCLAENPNERYESAVALLEAFRRVTPDHQPADVGGMHKEVSVAFQRNPPRFRGMSFYVLGGAALCVLLAVALWSACGRWTPPVPTTSTSDPTPVSRVEKIRFRYRVIKDVKHAGANLTGRLYTPEGKELTKAELEADARKNKQQKTEDPFFSEAAVVPGDISLTALLANNYAVNVEHDGGGVGHHTAIRFSVEVLTGDGVWHTVLGEDHENHAFNPYPGELLDGKPAKYYDLEDDPRRKPPSSQRTDRVTLKTQK